MDEELGGASGGTGLGAAAAAGGGAAAATGGAAGAGAAGGGAGGAPPAAGGEREADLEQLVGLEGQSIDCVVCMEPVVFPARRGDYCATPCDHVFHSSCLMPWLAHKMECPTCRCVCVWEEACCFCRLLAAAIRSFSPLPPHASPNPTARRSTLPEPSAR